MLQLRLILTVFWHSDLFLHYCQAKLDDELSASLGDVVMVLCFTMDNRAIQWSLSNLDL